LLLLPSCRLWLYCRQGLKDLLLLLLLLLQLLLTQLFCLLLLLQL
jgi:hypothetical protein